MPKLITAETGEDIALSCFPPEGNPRPTNRWRRRGAGGQLIPLDHTTDDKYSLDPSGVLLVRRPTRAEDAGQYECLVTNEEGTRVDSPVTLDIVDRRDGSQASGEDDDEESMDYYEEEERPMLTVPIITEAALLDRVTGLVRWTPVAEATAYLVLVMADQRPVANFSVEATISQVKLHSLDPAEEEYRVAVAAMAASGATNQPPPVFSASRPLLAAPVVRTSVLREFTIHPTLEEEEQAVEELVAGVPAHIWFLAVAVAILLTVLLVLAAGFFCQRAAAANRRQRKDPELGSGQTMPGNRGSYYYCSGGSSSSSSWLERQWTATDRNDQHFQTFKSDRRLLAVDNPYDYVVQADCAAAARESAEAYQYFAHYASVPIIKPTEAKSNANSNYSVLLPGIQPV